MPDGDFVDTNNDGVNDADQFDSGVKDIFGNRVVEVDGHSDIETKDLFGNVVLQNIDTRAVEATIEPDHDVRMDTGVTYTPVKGEVGWDIMHGTDGSVLTDVHGLTGLPEYQTTGSGTSASDQPANQNAVGDEVTAATDNTVSQDNVAYDAGGVTNGGVYSPRRLVTGRQSRFSGHRSSQSSFGKILGTLITGLGLSVVATFVSVFVMIVLSDQGVSHAIVTNGIVFAILAAFSIGLWLGMDLHKNFKATVLIFSLLFGYLFGLVAYALVMVR